MLNRRRNASSLIPQLPTKEIGKGTKDKRSRKEHKNRREEKRNGVNDRNIIQLNCLEFVRCFFFKFYYRF